jgi:hypothetical protein
MDKPGYRQNSVTHSSPTNQDTSWHEHAISTSLDYWIHPMPLPTHRAVLGQVENQSVPVQPLGECCFLTDTVVA